MSTRRKLRNFEVDGRAVDDLVDRILQLDEKLVRAGGKPVDADGFSAGIEPMPGQIIDGDVKVSDAGKNAQSVGAVDRHDPHVLGAVSNNHVASGQLSRQWRIDDEARGGLRRQRNHGGWCKFG